MEKKRRKPSLPPWVRRRSLPGSTAREIRQAVIADLHTTSAAGIGVFHGVALLNDVLIFTAVELCGPPDRTARMPPLEGRAVAELMTINPATISAFNTFEVHTVETVQGNIALDTTWRPAGFVGCVAMNAVVGGKLVGWVGGFRFDTEGPFEAEVLAALRPRVDAYVHALDVAQRMDGCAASDRGLILLEPSGEVAYACERGGEWLHDERFRRRLLREVRAFAAGAPAQPFWARGAVVRLTRVSGARGALCCADVAVTQPWEASPLGFLTMRKRQIAEVAALGATVDEIARSLGLKSETVRMHLRGIYETLGVASRVELAEKVREVGAKAVLPP